MYVFLEVNKILKRGLRDLENIEGFLESRI